MRALSGLRGHLAPATAFASLQIAPDFEGNSVMKASIYLLAVLMLVAASCGDSSNNEPELLFVQTANSAVLTDSRLTLTGINPNTGWFTDRPYREAGQVRTEEFLTLWDEGENSFADDPPNADFTCTVNGEVVNYVVELQNPILPVPYISGGCSSVACVLTYDVSFIGVNAVAESDAISCDGVPHLFIDAAFDWCPTDMNEMQLGQECIYLPTMYG
jgi:hypothetical protein